MTDSTPRGRFIPDAEMPQGSPAWDGWREPRLSASDAAEIMGQSPTWRRRRNADTEHLRTARERNARLKPLIRDAVNAEIEGNFQPVCVEASMAGLPLGASLAGYDPDYSDTGSWLEIKVPTGNMTTLRQISAGRDFREIVPPYVHWQLVHQYAVLEGALFATSGKEKLAPCVFVAVAIEDPSSGRFAINVQHYDNQTRPSDFTRDVSILLRQWARSPQAAELEATFDPDSWPFPELRPFADHEPREMVRKYREARSRILSAKAEAEIMRRRLELAPDDDYDSALNYGITFEQRKRRGSIPYRKIVESLVADGTLSDEEVEAWRRAPSESTVMVDDDRSQLFDPGHYLGPGCFVTDGPLTARPDFPS